MSAFNLIVCAVPRNKGEAVTKAARNAGSTGGTVIMARGFSRSAFLHLLSLGDRWLDIVCVLTPKENCKRITDAIKKASCGRRKAGSMFVINDADTSITAKGNAPKAEGDMAADEMKTEYKLITVIANKGYADDIMAAARAAGAGGGTVINARGTAKEGDATFFGMEIVPEKDMLAILVSSEKANKILTAIRSLPCLAKPGSGIAFCMGASNFTALGGKGLA